MASTDSVKVQTRLPSYFPLVPKGCEKDSAEFFTCFEQRSKMKTPDDRASAKQGLAECQPQLAVYMRCVEAAQLKADKPWWKVW